MGRVGDFLVGAYCGLPEITNEFSGWQNLFTTSPPLSHLGQDLAAKDQRYDATSHKSPSDTNQVELVYAFFTISLSTLSNMSSMLTYNRVLEMSQKKAFPKAKQTRVTS